ncbi:hypothetical protein HBI56_140300 [Parastagonospora nodorum]|nr:hypothetical protein HBH54_095990 [Parastagonospora nodorum]KAH4019102.1 hypothetical protein HBI13_130480 [Parastagonospora nodorum]KAH4028590.1 hypothetical protein HBI09_139160 [Parastagonospora nodorum]KAH4070654.1 hypothetical protein HBH50_086710 [Parastagonospora nodorum]KAH4105203.1 hypothetical protein HBH46_090650 [Parastagonospora nodorum]
MSSLSQSLAKSINSHRLSNSANCQMWLCACGERRAIDTHRSRLPRSELTSLSLLLLFVQRIFSQRRQSTSRTQSTQLYTLQRGLAFWMKSGI